MKSKNQKIYKVAVVGGGASGLTAAILLSERLGGEVVVLERLNRVGKKITVTGNGRGNVTNKNISCKNYHSVGGGAEEFVSFSLEAFGSRDTEELLNSLGVLTTCEGDRVYPSSFQASSVLDLMRARLEFNGCEVRTEFFVKEIKRGEAITVVGESGECVLCQNVILAVGGNCQKQLGTDGIGYEIVRSLGFSVTELYPSLVQIKTDMTDIKALKGVRQDVRLTLLDRGKQIRSERGDVIFTEFGISGNAVFQLSSSLGGRKGLTVRLELLPDVGRDELATYLKNKLKATPYLEAEDLLTGIVNKQVGKAIVKRAGLDLSKKCPISHVNCIVELIKGFEIKVLGTLGFNYAQVTRGGVGLDQIDNKTMGLKGMRGVYVTGEVMDIDGDCGGYNLQWAFSSAFVAASDILRRLGI